MPREMKEGGIELHNQVQTSTKHDHKHGDGIQIQAQDDNDVEIQKPVYIVDNSGVARIEAIQAVWGVHGKKIIIAGLALVMVMFELDNTTVYT